jgi:DNA-binding IclR family transcriptional regulator
MSSRSAAAQPAVASPRAQRGIQSVEVGGQLLRALAHQGVPMALKDLAHEAGMAPAKAHPYLVSFGKLGLIAQDPASGHYGLGPLAMQLGLISLQQFDPVRLAAPHLRTLALSLGLTVAIAVWGNRGPTVVRIEAAPTAVHVNMRHGTVMSLRGTASGRLFAAWLPEATLAERLADEGLRASGAAFRSELAQVRRDRFSHVVDGAVAGVSALAVPVFDESGAMVLSLTAIGPTALFDAAQAHHVAAALQAVAQRLSRQLGAHEPVCASA